MSPYGPCTYACVRTCMHAGMLEATHPNPTQPKHNSIMQVDDDSNNTEDDEELEGLDLGGGDDGGGATKQQKSVRMADDVDGGDEGGWGLRAGGHARRSAGRWLGRAQRRAALLALAKAAAAFLSLLGRGRRQQSRRQGARASDRCRHALFTHLRFVCTRPQATARAPRRARAARARRARRAR